MPPAVRPATPADVPTIATSDGRAVHAGVATFDTTDPPDSYWRDKLASTAPGDHTVVIEDAGEVVGYAYSSAFRPRPAYARTRETSIYLAPAAVGRGLGRLTHSHLLALLRADGVHSAVAVVAPPNPASTALHGSLGLELVGTLREVGRKFDRPKVVRREDSLRRGLCGDGVRMAPAVRHARLELHLEKTGGTEAHAEAWLTDPRATSRRAEGVCAFSKQHRCADPAMPSGLDTAT